MELIYPLESDAPLLPLRSLSAASVRNSSAPARQHSAASGEMFPVVDEEGVVIGRSPRTYCHGGSHLLHPVVHLHLISRDEKIYIQKRSMKKALLPGKWDTAVGGHVMYGESIMEALMRESAEELSLTEFNPIYLGTYRWDTARESELVNIFAAVGKFKVRPDRDEVEEGRWWDIPEIMENLGGDIFTPNFVSEFTGIKDKLLALL